MTVTFIRHGQTAGNAEKRYVGRTDEPLSDAGRSALSTRAYPVVSRVYISPMLRCTQTAEVIYPGVPRTVIHDFRECDFGEFEYKNYWELNGDSRYQAWIDSGGEIPFPGGESKAVFSARCVAAYREVARELALRGEDVAIIAHGGTLMAVLEAFAHPRRPYFDWQTPPGGGFTLNWISEDALALLLAL